MLKNRKAAAWIMLGFALLCLVCVFFLPGCGSAKNEIGQAATVATTAATESKVLLTSAAEAIGRGSAKVALDLIQKAIAKQDIIIAAASGIQGNLARVEDKENWFEKLLKWWPVLPVVGVIAALAYLGILPIAVRFVGFLFSIFPRIFSGLIPPRVHSEAKLDAEAVNGGGHALMEQSIAAKRSNRPAYAAAFNFYNQKKKRRTP